ncbi:MAG: Lrp/AsnC family transcriptional regulator [Nanoarchaeota archaeon]
MRISNFRGEIDWKAMPQRIDLIDKKIAYLLGKNSRLSNTAIAKALKLKREVVSYRIKKMHERNFLHGFVARVNVRKIGMIAHNVYLKLKTPTNEKEMIDDLMKIKEITNLKNVGGRFDISIETTSKNMEEFDVTLRKILDKYNASIQDYAILNTIQEYPWDLDLLLEECPKELERLSQIKESKGSSYHKELENQEHNSEMVEVDPLDLKILNLIKLNARMNLKDIADEAGSNFITVNKHLSRLVQKGVISTFSTFFSLAQMGYQMYPVLFNLRNLDERKFITFMKHHPNILWSYRTIGNWNYQVNIFARSNAHFHDLFNDIRQNFSENIVSFDTIMVFNSFKVEQRIE